MSRRAISVLVSVAAAAFWAAEAAADRETCARLAGDPRVTGGVGVAFDDISPRRAIAACRAVVLADPDDIESSFRLGRSYLAAGTHASALPHIRRAAEADYPVAVLALGLSYLNGWGVPEDPARALEAFERAHDLGFAYATMDLAWFHLNGVAVPADEARAVAYYREAAEAGVAAAQAEMASRFMRGAGVAEDDAEGYRLAVRAADQGNGFAAYLAGFALERGLGVGRDLATAAKRYEEAAEAGEQNGTVSLAKMLAEGRGLPADPARARALLAPLAEAGNAEARAWMARFLVLGLGGPTDLPGALALIEQSGDEPAAQHVRGLLAWSGNGVAQDRPGGLSLIRAAADAGVVQAQVDAASILGGRNGAAEFRDDRAAVAYLERAAAREHPRAMAMLGLRLTEGSGIARDVGRGLALLDKAAAAGVASAGEAADLVRQRQERARRLAELDAERCALQIALCNRGCTEGADGRLIYNTRDGQFWFRSDGRLVPEDEAPDYGCPQ